ncbi:MAG: TAXI family TRAP transporter solute-binding subunit [Treponema sp.]|nr:TAXI family TRAP transporter solute-binding subunit [Treponema sp.]
MKKALGLMLAATVITNSLFAAPKKKTERLAFGTGSTGGNFYLIGGGLATILNNKLDGKYIFTAEETGGGTANLSMIENGDLDVGIAMTSSLSEGLNGTAKWTNGKAMKNVRALVPLYPSFMTMYVLEGNAIHTLSDVNGKIVGLGSKGASMDGVLRTAFEKMGLKPASIFNDGHGATATAVSQGQVDIAVLFSYPPFAAITQLEATKKLRFIGLTDKEQKYLSENYPFYSPAVLPKGSYQGVTSDIPTISEWNMLVGSAKLSDDTAYTIAKTLFENNPELLVLHKSLAYCAPEYEKNFNIPLHPGVIKYLKEKGITIPKHLIP